MDIEIEEGRWDARGGSDGEVAGEEDDNVVGGWIAVGGIVELPIVGERQDVLLLGRLIVEWWRWHSERLLCP